MNSLTDLLRFEINETNLPIRVEQVRSRINSYPLMLVSQLLLAPLLLALMWGQISHAVLQAWLVTIYFVHGVEFYFWRRYRLQAKGV